MLRRISDLLLTSISTLAFMTIASLSTAQAETAAYRAQRVSFHVDSRPDGFTRVYYSCSSVESQIESLLAQMGARNIDVRCTGGIDSHLPEIAWESDVDARYDSLVQVGAGAPGAISADFRAVRIHVWDSCYLLHQAFSEVAPSFVLRNVYGPNTCSGTGGSFRVDLTTLYP